MNDVDREMELDFIITAKDKAERERDAALARAEKAEGSISLLQTRLEATTNLFHQHHSSGQNWDYWRDCPHRVCGDNLHALIATTPEPPKAEERTT